MSETIQGYRLSPRQQDLWRLGKQGAHPAAQLVLRLAGPLDEAALDAALGAVAHRHAALRTAFPRVPGLALPLQTVDEAAVPAWRREDLRSAADGAAALATLAAAERERAFDLERAPSVAAVLARLPEGGHGAVLTLPALCADRASLAVLGRDLAAAYGAAAAGESAAGGGDDEAVQYVQFAAWQEGLLQEPEEKEAAERFWNAQPGRDAGRRLPFADEAAQRAARRAVELPAGTAAAVERVAQRAGAEPAAVLAAAWAALLARHAAAGRGADTRTGGGEAVPLAVLLDERRIEDLAEVCGPLAAPVPLAVEVDPAAPFLAAVASAQRALLAAHDRHETYAPAAGVGPAELPACGFELAHGAPAVEAAGVRFEPLAATVEGEPLELVLRCRLAGGELAAEVAGRRGEGVLGHLAEQWAALVAAALADPARPVATLPLVAGTGDAAAVLLGESVDLAGEATVPERIARHAERRPEAPAVRGAGGDLLTYGELVRRAGVLAARLAAAGAGTGGVVALMLPPGPDAVVALLAVWRAGAAYLPLEPGHPAARLDRMLAAVRPAVLVTDAERAPRLPRIAGLERVPVVRVEEPAEPAAAVPDGTPADAGALADAGDLAYVLFTSGSTGTPKGVMVSHGALANYVRWAAAAYGVRPGAAVPVLSPLTFDLTVTSLLVPLAAGAEARFADAEQPLAPAGGEAAALVKLTPSHLRLLASDAGGQAGGAAGGAVDARLLVVGGEALHGEQLAAWRRRDPGVRVVNEYGPTEATVGCCVHEVPPGTPPPGPVPIGGPIANTRLAVLGADLLPAAVGMAGELYVAGAGLARGYASDPRTTAERFLPDPFAERPGERMYRTGDLVHRRADGDLAYRGRADEQLKIRGFRIEPGEVEAVLRSHPALAEAVAGGHDDGSGELRLVAHLVAAGASRPGVEELRRFLAERLPEPMVPSAFVYLDSLPLTRHGKVDRAALPPPGDERPELEHAYEPPEGPVETVLAAAWAETLGLDRIGVHDNFFVLGGDSMRSVRAVATARRQGVVFEVQDLFRHPTVRALAGYLAETGGSAPAGAETAAAPPEAPEELDHLLDELEGLSEDEVRRRLAEHEARAGEGVQ